MKTTLMMLTAVFSLSLGVAACDDKKEDAKGDKADKGDKGGDAKAEDPCAKAQKCVEGLVKADPEGAKAIQSAWDAAQKKEGDAKVAECKQVLKGAAFNPKAPAECK